MNTNTGQAKGNIFDTVMERTPQYSTFDLSYDHKLSLQMGKLIPVHTQACLPGDKHTINPEAMFRMMPMVAPPMHRVTVTFHHFFVPNRILWPKWEEFITGGETYDPLEVPPAYPRIQLEVVQASDLANYLGCPVTGTILDPADMMVSAMPFAAYQRIYHEYYRSETLQVEDPIELTDGNNVAQITELTRMRNRGWQHDYFTSALPDAQKGAVVELPMDFNDVPVEWRLTQDGVSQWRIGNSGAVSSASGALETVSGVTRDSNSEEVQYDPGVSDDSSLVARTNELVTSTTINDLRTAWALQQWLEKNMRAGSRYKESLINHFNTSPTDERLQRPEYFGGTKGVVTMSEVLQTSSTDVTSPQGTMAGHGVSILGGNSATYVAKEWGYIITMLSVMPDTSYFQGLPKDLFKFDRMEFGWPTFANLGEQEILNKEVFYDIGDGENDLPFGYIPRNAEYKYNPSRVSGEMATTLDFWHMARKFASRPALNAAFIESDPTNRIFAVTEGDTMIAHVLFKIHARRPLPAYSIPAPLV